MVLPKGGEVVPAQMVVVKQVSPYIQTYMALFHIKHDNLSALLYATYLLTTNTSQRMYQLSLTSKEYMMFMVMLVYVPTLSFDKQMSM